MKGCFVELLGGVAGGQAQQTAKLFRLLLIFFGVEQEFYAVIIAAAMAHHASGADRPAGKWRREFNRNFVAGLQFQSGKYQDAALTHVIATARHYFGRSVIGKDDPNGQVEPEPLPAPENCSFCRSFATWD